MPSPELRTWHLGGQQQSAERSSGSSFLNLKLTACSVHLPLLLLELSRSCLTYRFLCISLDTPIDWVWVVPKLSQVSVLNYREHHPPPSANIY